MSQKKSRLFKKNQPPPLGLKKKKGNVAAQKKGTPRPRKSKERIKYKI